VVVMMAVNWMHVQWVQMRMSVVMIQVCVKVRVMVSTLFIHLEGYVRHFDANVAETRRCWTTMDANEFLRT
jgi:hypothetical protein